MSRKGRSVVVLSALALPLAVAAGCFAWLHDGGGVQAVSAARVLGARERMRLAAVSVPFVPNRGQADSRVAYYAPTFAGTVYVTRTGTLVLALPAKPDGSRDAPAPVLVETPVSTNPVLPVGIDPARTRVSVLQGRARSDWRRNLPTYAEVMLGKPWPGVAYAVRAHGANVERIFTLAPGAHAGAIRMKVTGARTLALDHGALVAETSAGPVTYSVPLAYQQEGGNRERIPVVYTLDGDTFGFRLGEHDPSRPVVIDPLIRATYLGAYSLDSATAGAVANNGDVYLAGMTKSISFPGTSGAAQPAYGGGLDAFVARLGPNLEVLDRATYLGGSNPDSATAIALGPSGSPEAGDVYVTGDTQSVDFPGTAGGAQPACAGTADDCRNTGDAFVAVLSPDLSSLIQATYLGGTDIDDAHALAIGSAGTVYVAGRTLSADFPGTTGGAQPVPQGSSYDAFVAELSPDLTTLDQSTYLGGSSVDEAYALTLDPANGDVYVAGDTGSSDFPCTTAGGPPPAGGGACGSSTAGAQSSYAGAFDAFISQLNPALTTLEQSTYLGGTGFDQVQAMTFGPNGDLYAAGQTFSTDLPGISGAAQPVYGGNGDAFAARLNPAITSFKRVTYLGGSGSDTANALVIVSGTGDVYVAGTTQSTDFPCTAPDGPDPSGGSCASPHAGAQPTLSGSSDAFIALLNPGLDQLTQASYFGGNGAESGSAVALAPSSGTATGDVYVAGQTTSANLPGTAGAAQTAYQGSGDAFGAKLSADLQGPQIDMTISVDAPSQANTGDTYNYSITVTNSTAPTSEFDGIATNVSMNDVLPPQVTYQSSTSSQGDACTELGGVVTCDLGTIPANGGSASASITVQVASAGSAVNAATLRADQAFTTDSVIDVSTNTNIPQPNSGSGGASLLGPLTLIGLAGLALAALFGVRRRG